ACNTDKTRLPATGLESRWLVDRLDECHAREQVLILDCCFSGAFAHHAKGAADMEIGVALTSGDHGTPKARGRVVLTASRAGEYSFEGAPLDGTPSGSVFTTGLIDGIRTGRADTRGRGWITVGEAYEYAFDFVQENAAAQTPQLFAERLEG